MEKKQNETVHEEGNRLKVMRDKAWMFNNYLSEPTCKTYDGVCQFLRKRKDILFSVVGLTFVIEGTRLGTNFDFYQVPVSTKELVLGASVNTFYDINPNEKSKWFIFYVEWNKKEKCIENHYLFCANCTKLEEAVKWFEENAKSEALFDYFRPN